MFDDVARMAMALLTWPYLVEQAAMAVGCVTKSSSSCAPVTVITGTRPRRGNLGEVARGIQLHLRAGPCDSPALSQLNC